VDSRSNPESQAGPVMSSIGPCKAGPPVNLSLPRHDAEPHPPSSVGYDDTVCPVPACELRSPESDEFHTCGANATVHEAYMGVPADTSQFKCIGQREG
jgi:hypothetical protein